MLQVLFYVVIGLFLLLGLGSLSAASRTNFRHIGLIFGALCYLGTAIGAYYFSSWWAFLIGIGAAWGFRLLGGDPSK